MKAQATRIVVIAGLAAALAIGAFAIAGCSSGSQTSSSSAGSSSASSSASSAAIVGGWEVPATAESILTADEKAIYDSASGTDSSVQPIALLATQVVSGMNYAYLGKGATGWDVLVCYKNIEGKARLSSTKAIDLANIKTIEASSDESQPESIVGGWTVQAPAEPAGLPQEAQSAFTKALEGYAGVGFTPIALLGTQVVAGTNYLVLCEGSAVVQDPTPELYVVEVYENLQGNAEVTSAEPFDLLYYIGN